jgi:hypothetical protein
MNGKSKKEKSWLDDEFAVNCYYCGKELLTAPIWKLMSLGYLTGDGVINYCSTHCRILDKLKDAN